MINEPSRRDKATRAVLRVGDGRGFVVEGKYGRHPQRLVITAAHCLPSLPPCHGASHLEERTYGTLLGPLGEDATVCAECLFADPIADIAVLGEPDGQELYDESERYEALMNAAATLRIAGAPEEGGGLLLSLDQLWLPCRIQHVGGPLWTSEAKTVGGMSGSPIITEDGRAVGVVCTGCGSEATGVLRYPEGPHARLMRSLPGWMLPPRGARNDQPVQPAFLIARDNRRRPLRWPAPDGTRDQAAYSPDRPPSRPSSPVARVSGIFSAYLASSLCSPAR